MSRPLPENRKWRWKVNVVVKEEKRVAAPIPSDRDALKGMSRLSRRQGKKFSLSSKHGKSYFCAERGAGRGVGPSVDQSKRIESSASNSACGNITCQPYCGRRGAE